MARSGSEPNAGTTTNRRVRRLVGLVWSAALLGAAVGLVLAFVNDWPIGFDPFGILTIGAVTIGSLGALVSSRQPRNAIGWFMLSMGAMDGIASFGLQYGYLGTMNRDLVAAEFFATVPYGVAIGMVFGITITFFLLLFPDGRLPSHRWRPVAFMAAAGIAAMTVGLTWFTVDLGSAAMYAQLAVGGIDADGATGVAKLLNEAGHVLVFIAFPLSVASLFARRRTSTAIEHQQLRWFAYGAVIFLTAIFLPLPEPFGLWYEVAATTFLFAAIGIAILRYRLYDIDRLVSRTVTYAIVIGSLAAIYLLVIVALHAVLPTDSDLAAAVSTLAAAAAFNPLRRRVKAVVDRRFNRARYDAARTVEELTGRLRGTADVAAVEKHLLQVAGEVTQPTHVSLWLREPHRD